MHYVFIQRLHGHYGLWSTRGPHLQAQTPQKNLEPQCFLGWCVGSIFKGDFHRVFHIRPLFNRGTEHNCAKGMKSAAHTVQYNVGYITRAYLGCSSSKQEENILGT